LQISPGMLEKIQTASLEYLGAWGTLIHEKTRDRSSRNEETTSGLTCFL
jgi:hypothetical protein